MSYVEEIKAKGKLIVVGDNCSWYSYYGMEYIVYNSGSYIECESSLEADEYFEQAENREED